MSVPIWPAGPEPANLTPSRRPPQGTDGRLDPWLDSPGTAGVFVDFDGTLAPIVEDFERAAPIPGAAERLRHLSSRLARVAVISGRPLAYLLSHLADVGDTELIGLYGLDRALAPSPAAEEWRETLTRAASEAESAAPAGVVVERKGLAVTLHFRAAPDQAGWTWEFARHQESDEGLVAHPGKMSVELRPPVSTDKGTVVAELGAGLAAVMFIGDDMGDLPAFAALARMRQAGATTLAVAVAGPETPVMLLDSADRRVDGPAGVLDLLAALGG